MTILPPGAPDRHDCRRVLPWVSHGYGSTGLDDGTVALCPVCDTAWVSSPSYDSLGPTSRWRKVRRWHPREVRDRVEVARRAPRGPENWAQAVERAIHEDGAEAVLRRALEAMWVAHAGRFDHRDGKRDGPDSFYAGVGHVVHAIMDAVDPRLRRR